MNTQNQNNRYTGPNAKNYNKIDKWNKQKVMQVG